MTTTNHSARRINTLATLVGARRYLEIGVDRGATFVDVKMAEKVGVDPCFRFDAQSHRASGVQLLEITSDQFFATHAAARKPFDLIFLDGLHTFEQTFRDFCASQACAHDQTVWLIDDVLPRDVYSSLRTPDDALHFRRSLTGGDSLAWHGDVFKVVVAIHDFFPSFSYCTVVDGGNAQTVVFRAARRDFRPVLNSLETVSRLDYFAFLRMRQVLNEVPELGLTDWLASVRRQAASES